MPSRQFPLEPNGPNRLKITWQGTFFYVEKNIQVVLDGKVIGEFPTRIEFVVGKEFQVDRNSTLFVWLENHKIKALYNDLELDKLNSRPMLWQASFLFLFWGAWSMVEGVNVLLATQNYLIGSALIFCGAGFFGLNLYVKTNLLAAVTANLWLLVANRLLDAWANSHMTVSAWMAVVCALVVTILLFAQRKT